MKTVFFLILGCILSTSAFATYPQENSLTISENDLSVNPVLVCGTLHQVSTVVTYDGYGTYVYYPGYQEPTNLYQVAILSDMLNPRKGFTRVPLYEIGDSFQVNFYQEALLKVAEDLLNLDPEALNQVVWNQVAIGGVDVKRLWNGSIEFCIDYVEDEKVTFGDIEVDSSESEKKNLIPDSSTLFLNYKRNHNSAGVPL